MIQARHGLIFSLPNIQYSFNTTNPKSYVGHKCKIKQSCYVINVSSIQIMGSIEAFNMLLANYKDQFEYKNEMKINTRIT